jgi:6-pyruvoyltetrahydropterin/6-carboxytetrahydropterin synthase
MPYLTSKTFGGASGFSCCFRDHNDQDSTLGQLHGSVLTFKIMFESDTLDDNGRVLATFNMEDVEEFLDATFGHTTVVAQDDPSMEAFDQLDEDGAIDLVVLPQISLETFCKSVFDYCEHWLKDKRLDERVWTHSVECREHEGSSAIYARDDSVVSLVEEPSTPS